MSTPKVKCKKCGTVSPLNEWGVEATGRTCPNCWTEHTDAQMIKQTMPDVGEKFMAPVNNFRITYGASVTVPHPRKAFANCRPTLEVTADCIEADRDVALVALKTWVHSALQVAIQELHELQ